ncbi:MAG TPA: CehA/McbA family metallohydrolase [Pyrinomonadaceae bacterium]|nr:CehA/McbA family metallohydrolase [Pyrinomonadaceae bacterium]
MRSRPRVLPRFFPALLYLSLSCFLVGSIHVFADTSSKSPNKPAPRTTTSAWYRGNTHTHTTNSDGDSSPLAVATRYKELGYNFVVITDHNLLTEVSDLNAQLGESGQFLVMQGEEVTDSYGSKPVHLISINNQGVVPIQRGWSVLSTIENDCAAIKQAGGLPYVAHPNFAYGIAASDLQNMTGTALFEIHNAHPFVWNAGDATHPSVETMWDQALSSGHLLYGIGSDDEHTLTNVAGPMPGRAWIMVRATSLEPGAITDAIQRGDFYASTGVRLQDYQVGATGITMSVDNSSGSHSTIDFIGRNGQLLQRNTGDAAAYAFTGSEMYVRARIVNDAGQTAWTQPVFTFRLNSNNAIVNGASMGAEPQSNKVVAPDSLAVVSGFGLARAALQSERTDGVYPTQLGGTSVTVNGRPAEIYYVSSTQVNFHVPDETELGDAEVVITNTGGSQLHSLITVESVAPGIFTEDGSGQGKAVTFETTKLLPSLFFPNDHLRRFFLYVTGVRDASQFAVLVNGQAVTIEAVKEARRLPGLFQINVAMPEGLTNAATLVLRANGKDSNAVTLPPE